MRKFHEPSWGRKTPIIAGGVDGYDPAPKCEGRKLRYENVGNLSGLAR